MSSLNKIPPRKVFMHRKQGITMPSPNSYFNLKKKIYEIVSEEKETSKHHETSSVRLIILMWMKLGIYYLLKRKVFARPPFFG